MRLAHFSDIHVSHWPLRSTFALKRALAVASYSILGRGRHFAKSEDRIAALLADIDEQKVDHALCTGDLTSVAGESELRRCALLFGARLQAPDRFTVLPGNHDRYVASAEGAFEHHFSRLCEGAHFPFVKRFGPSVTLVCIDSARPTSLIDSSGHVGPQARAKLLEILTDASLQNQFVILALHYALLRSNGARDRAAHGLRDDLELLELIGRHDVTLDLVLHGHLHRPFRLQTHRRMIVNAGSATDLHVDCGYNLYDIDPQAHRVTIERRNWQANAGRYVATQMSNITGTFLTRER